MTNFWQIKQQVILGIVTLHVSILQAATPPQLSVEDNTVEYIGSNTENVQHPTLSDYINNALNNHPIINADRSRAKAAKFEIAVAASGEKLKLSAGASAGTNTSNNLTRLTPTITAKYPLYTSGRVSDDIEAKTALFDSAKTKVRATCEDVAKRTLDLFQAVLIEQESVAILRSQVKSLVKLRTKVLSIANIDKGRASELWQVQSRLGLVKSQLDARILRLTETRSQLANYTNSNVSHLVSYELSSVVASRSDYVLLLNEHPKVIAAKFESEAATANARLASKWNKPNVTLEMQANANAGELAFNEKRIGISLNFTGNLDMMDGGAGIARAMAESERQLAAQATIDSLIYDLTVDLDREYLANEQRRTRIPALQLQVSNADKIRQAGQEQFNIGRRTLLELITFENDFFAALLELKQEEIYLAMGNARIAAAAGALSRSSNIDNPRCAL